MLDEDKTKEQLIAELRQLRTCVAESEQDEKDRKRLESALVESEYRLKLLYQQAPIPYQSLDEQGNLIAVNQAWLDALGYHEEEVIGKHITRFLHPAWHNHFKENFPKLKAAGEIRGVELEMVKKDRSAILVAFNGKVMRTPEGMFQQTHCIFQDITEQKKAEDSLRESESTFRNLFNNSAVGMFRTRLDGSEVLNVNEKFLEIFGRTREEVIGKPSAIHWADPGEREEMVRRLKAHGRVIDFECKMLNKNGEVRHCITSLNLYPKEGILDGSILDVTERKLANEALHDSELRLRTILQTANEGFWLIDNDAVTLDLNPRMCAILGRNRGEILGKKIFDFVDNENKAIFERHIALSVKGQKGAYEIALSRRDGTKVLCRFSGTPLLDGSGNKIGAFAMVTDITKRKRAEEALRASEALFKNLFEHHIAVKLIIDPDTGNIIDANKAAATYYGWPKERLQQMTIQEINLLPPEQVKREMQNARALKRIYFEFQHRRADGSIRDVEVYSSNIEVAGKDLLHSIVHDVTERWQIERERQESEARYRNLFENAPVGIYTATSEGRLLMANSYMARTLGLDSPQQTVEYYNDLRQKFYVNPDQRDRFLQALQEEGYVENQEHKARTGDGRTIWVSLNAQITQQNADESFIIEGFMTDITARRKLEEQFRQAQKMESVGRLAGGVAHDYNNMLGVILGYTEMALDSVAPSQQLYDDLQEIRKAAQESARVTRQLLAFARKQAIVPKPIDLNQTVEGMLKMLRRLIGEDIDLAWMPTTKLWPVMMDPSQIDQMLANLCVNARDAIAGVGKITIETGKVTFDKAYCDDHLGFIPGDFVLLAVSDDGCGMDKETQKNLFEPFFTTKGVGEGTGLGLATVYGIVKQNNGSINVYSEPGQGSTFKIYLRRHKGQAVEAGKESSMPIPPAQGETVLIVEDEIAVLNLSKSMLERLGYTVLSAITAAEALRLAETHADVIDLLITDVVMPKMNGRELADAVATFRPNLKILFMSGYTANVIAHQGVLDAGVCFIQKPFSRKELAVKVREALRKK